MEQSIIAPPVSDRIALTKESLVPVWGRLGARRKFILGASLVVDERQNIANIPKVV